MKLREALLEHKIYLDIVFLLEGSGFGWLVQLRRCKSEEILCGVWSHTFTEALREAIGIAQVNGHLPEPINLSGFAADELGV